MRLACAIVLAWAALSAAAEDDAEEIIVPPEILAKAELSDTFETTSIDKPPDLAMPQELDDSPAEETGFGVVIGPVGKCAKTLARFYDSRGGLRINGCFIYPLNISEQGGECVRAYCRCGKHEGRNVLLADGSTKCLDQAAFIQKLRYDARHKGIPTEMTSPDPDQKRAVASAILQLGDDDYDRREQAMQALREMCNFAGAQIALGTLCDDPEIASRCGFLVNERWSCEAMRELVRKETETGERAPDHQTPAAAAVTSSQK